MHEKQQLVCALKAQQQQETPSCNTCYTTSNHLGYAQGLLVSELS